MPTPTSINTACRMDTDRAKKMKKAASKAAKGRRFMI
jgi:hypothetical protein